jgi:hypothetical protein
MTQKTKFGGLPTTKVVKLVVPMSAELKEMLDPYAELHAEATGEKRASLASFPSCANYSWLGRELSVSHEVDQRASCSSCYLRRLFRCSYFYIATRRRSSCPGSGSLPPSPAKIDLKVLSFEPRPNHPASG